MLQLLLLLLLLLLMMMMMMMMTLMQYDREGKHGSRVTIQEMIQCQQAELKL